MDFHGYTIYKDGRVLSKSKKKYMTQSTDMNGYLRIQLLINGKNKIFRIHRLLAIYYIPNPDNLPIVDHIDRNRQNNDLTNLRWVSISENTVNCKMKKNNTSGYRHIINEVQKRDGHEYFCIKITRKRKTIYKKRFSKNKHTIDEVVRFRNIKYKELNIDIDD